MSDARRAVRSRVTDVLAAAPGDAAVHFAAALAFETDCADVHDALAAGASDFVLLDVRSPEAFAAGHVDGSLNLPHARIDGSALAAHPPETLFVVYCAGPHCNGADRAALRLARLGRPVKKTIGGITGWLDQGYPLVRGGDALSGG
jgi:rhodanese-related sulfurtransferase